MPFEFSRLDIPDVVLIKPKILKDERGFFLETFKNSDFIKNGINENFCQDNSSRSSKNVLRGLHYQLNPKSQGKLVRVLTGEILDVAVDIRINSPTFGKWIAYKLNDETKEMLYIPAGFAHGFLVLSDIAEISYKTTNEYSKEHEAGIKWDDKDININWEIEEKPIVSPKDEILPRFKDAINNFTYGENL